jgi:hypothetical protein
MSVLVALGLDPRVSEGTLLGGFRQQNFIGHDTDIDVALVGPVPVGRVLVAMYRSGFICIRLLTARFHVQQLAFLHQESGNIFDVIIWWEKSQGQMQASFPELDYVMSVPADQFGPPEFVQLQDLMFPTHSRPREWLEAQYGTGWEVPETTKSDWKLGRPFSHHRNHP